jgi:hypothetical protein
MYQTQNTGKVFDDRYQLLDMLKKIMKMRFYSCIYYVKFFNSVVMLTLKAYGG